MTEKCNKLDTGLFELADLEARILLINDHNSDTKHQGVRNWFKHKLMRHWPANRTKLSSSNIPDQNTYLPGSTLVSVLGKWTNRILSSELDPTSMGRWSCMNLREKKNKE